MQNKTPCWAYWGLLIQQFSRVKPHSEAVGCWGLLGPFRDTQHPVGPNTTPSQPPSFLGLYGDRAPRIGKMVTP